MQTDRVSKILRLIHDPVFADFEEAQKAISFFNVVGRTFTETWHSALLGWLLNPKSSHGLGDFALRRFMMLMLSNENVDVNRSLSIADLLIGGDSSQAVSLPNEYKPDEVIVGAVKDEGNKKGRIDVFVDGIKYNTGKLNISILVEMKVNDSIKASQCQKYIAYIEKRKTEGTFIYPVFVTPEWNLPSDWNLTKQYNVVFGSDQWIIINFQSLYDDVIVPSLAHNSLSDFGKVTLSEYVKTLKDRNRGKGNQRMAITAQEFDLAHLLLDKHGEAIKALWEILNPESDFLSSSTTEGEKRKPITIEIEGKGQFNGTSIPKLYESVLKYLVDNNLLKDIELPISTGSSRYLLSTSPQHPSGLGFFKTIAYKGFYMEGNKARGAGVQDLIRHLLERLNLSTKIVNL